MKKLSITAMLVVSLAAIVWMAVGFPKLSDAVVTPGASLSLNGKPAGPASGVGILQPNPPPSWLTHLPSALALARDLHKDVLLEFTSNGRTAAITPTEATLDTMQFTNTVSGQFVLARFNCHTDTTGVDDEAAIRDIWAERLEIKSFPYLVLLDSSGRAYAELDLSVPGTAAVESSIAGLRQRRVDRDTAFAKADVAAGIQRAQYLHEGLQLVGPYARAFYQPVMEEIVSLDAGDKAHLRDLYFPLVTQSRIDSAVQHEIYPLIDHQHFQAAIDRITQLLSEESPPAEQKQLLVAFQGQLYANLGDYATATRTLDAAVAIAPESNQVTQIRGVRDQLAQKQ